MRDQSPAESPGRYSGHIAVMKEMRWGWAELMTAPADLVDEILMHIHYRAAWERKKSAMDQTRKR